MVADFLTQEECLGQWPPLWTAAGAAGCLRYLVGLVRNVGHKVAGRAEAACCGELLQMPACRCCLPLNLSSRQVWVQSAERSSLPGKFTRNSILVQQSWPLSPVSRRLKGIASEACAAKDKHRLTRCKAGTKVPAVSAQLAHGARPVRCCVKMEACRSRLTSSAVGALDT